MFQLEFPLAELRPALYNPRRIGPDAIEQLRASLRTLGPIKAVIARDDRTIVAGHQRTKSMQEVGLTHAPVYLRKPRSDTLDISRVHKHIEQLCEDLAKRGRYDMVICDSVIISVTSVEAEKAVPGTVNALCQPSGTIVVSGRSRTYTDRLTAKRRVNTGKTRDVWFLDENGITAMYERGIWLYQKFHSIDQIRELGRTYIGPKFEIVDYDRGGEKEIRASFFAVVGLKTVELSREEAQSALRFEFNLPLPEGNRYGKANNILFALFPRNGVFNGY